MNISESIFTALFCFSMVFILLAVLYLLVVISTGIIRRVEVKAKK